MGRRMRGASLLDVVVALAVLALLIWLVRLDWRHAPPRPETAAQPAR